MFANANLVANVWQEAANENPPSGGSTHTLKCLYMFARANCAIPFYVC